MQQQVKDSPADVAAQQSPRPDAAEAAVPRRDTAALWRAIAGMAMSLALASLVVMMEFTGQAFHRADRMHRHVETLLSRVAWLERQIAAEHARVSTARRDLAAAGALRAVLRAPDAIMVQLSPPNSAPAAGHRGAALAERPEATLALGPKEHRAVLMVAGLKPAADNSPFALWWSAARGAPVRAAEFRPATDGSAIVVVALPAGLDVTTAIVVDERREKAPAASTVRAPAQTGPEGPVLLRGTLAR
jgi:hypothetical protein